MTLIYGIRLHHFPCVFSLLQDFLRCFFVVGLDLGCLQLFLETITIQGLRYLPEVKVIGLFAVGGRGGWLGDLGEEAKVTAPVGLDSAHRDARRYSEE